MNSSSNLFEFGGLCKAVVRICFGSAVPEPHTHGDGIENKVEGKNFKLVCKYLTLINFFKLLIG